MRGIRRTGRDGGLSFKNIAEQISALGRDIDNRAISFSLQATKSAGSSKTQVVPGNSQAGVRNSQASV